MKKLKNSLELPNPTRNTRKFANKLITDTSRKINLQSKQDIISHVAKMKPTLCYNFSFESNASISNGNRTEWSPIQSVIIRVITNSDDRAAGVRFVYHEYDYRLNWTTRSPIIN